MNYLWSEIWPTRELDTELNPKELFAKYEQALEKIEKLDKAINADRLLEMSRHLYDDEEARRIRTETNTSHFFTLAGVLVPIAVGLIAIMQSNISEVRLFFFITILFLWRATLGTFDVFRSVPRHCLGPDDFIFKKVNSAQHFDRQLSAKFIQYAIENYKINNRKAESFRIAQMCFRNATLCMLLGGIMHLSAVNILPSAKLCRQALGGWLQASGFSGIPNKANRPIPSMRESTATTAFTKY